MPFDCFHARSRQILAALVCAVVMTGGGAARAQIGPQSVDLIDRLCAQTLRTNEEDRLYGMISLAVRATISYRGGEFQRNVIDDAVQNALDTLMADCPKLTAADPSKRVDMAVDTISAATTKVLADGAGARKSAAKDMGNPHAKKQAGKVTAADLSQELSSQEIDQWVNSMPPRERALSLFLYASNVTQKEIAEEVGEKPGAIGRQLATGKADLLHIYDENWQEPLSGPKANPAMKYTEAGEGFEALMTATEKPATPAAPTPPPAADTTVDAAGAAPVRAPGNNTPDNGIGALKVTGISDLLYSGWSLIATARGLPRGQRIAVTQPFLIEPDSSAIKRMLVTDIAEISDPDADTRRFLLKAYAVDADKEAAGLHDSFHVGPPLDNAEAKKTLANPDLTSIEVTRCLQHDFGGAPDPGLCRSTEGKSAAALAPAAPVATLEPPAAGPNPVPPSTAPPAPTAPGKPAPSP